MRFSSTPLTYVVATLAICTLLIAVMPGAALASQESSGESPQADESGGNFRTTYEAAFDILVLRPLDAAALVGGGVLMIPAAVFGFIGGKEAVQDSWDILILSSWESLVDRPLGHWGS